MRLSELRDILLSVTPNTFHYSANEQKGNYIVWAEEGQGEVEYADDKILSQGIVGTILYFTKTEFDPTFDAIQNALNSNYISWSLESIEYDEKIEYIIYVWKFEIMNLFEG
jgi:hypothetical protein